MSGAPRPARTRSGGCCAHCPAAGWRRCWTAARIRGSSYLEFSSERGSVERRFLLDAIGYLRDLVDGAGWDAEYPRDVWLLRRLGYPGRDNCAAVHRDRADLAAAVDQTLGALAAVDRHVTDHRRRGRAGDHRIRAVVPRRCSAGPRR